jgi:hypothetical protein
VTSGGVCLFSPMGRLFYTMYVLGSIEMFRNTVEVRNEYISWSRLVHKCN